MENETIDLVKQGILKERTIEDSPKTKKISTLRIIFIFIAQLIIGFYALLILLLSNFGGRVGDSGSAIFMLIIGVYQFFTIRYLVKEKLHPLVTKFSLVVTGILICILLKSLL